MLDESMGEQQQNAALAMANQRPEEPVNSTMYKGNAGLKVASNVENLDFGLIGHQKLPPHQTVSQTPRLKASTFKSPLLVAAVAEPVKRANSLLDHDLAFMSTSVL